MTKLDGSIEIVACKLLAAGATDREHKQFQKEYLRRSICRGNHAPDSPQRDYGSKLGVHIERSRYELSIKASMTCRGAVRKR